MPSDSVSQVDEPTGLARQALANPSFTWLTVEGGSIRMHYQPGSFAAKHRAALLRSAIVSLKEALHFIEAVEYRGPIHLFYVQSREEMEQLVGRGTTGSTEWESNSIFLVCNPEWPSFDQHEIVHAVTLNIWGLPAEPVLWIREGLAVYIDGHCGGYTVDEIAHYFLQHDQLPSLDTLIYRFREQSDGNILGCV